MTDHNLQRCSVLTIDKEKLQEVQDDQKRVESIEMYIKSVTPLNIKVSAGVFQQVFVANQPGKDIKESSFENIQCINNPSKNPTHK